MQPTSPDLQRYSFKAAFDSDTEVHNNEDNALLLFALALHLRVEDVKELAAEGFTDGGNDKKVDFCFLDVAEGRVVIAQSYFGKE